MPNVKSMGNSDKILKLLRHSPNGKKINDIAKKLGIDRSTVYDHLNSLDLKKLAHYERGIAYLGKVGEKHSTALSDRPKLFRQLIPAFREIAEIIPSRYSVSSGEEEYPSSEDMPILVKMAEEYLKTDPKLQRPL